MLSVIFFTCILSQAQEPVTSPKKPAPSQVLPDILVLGNPVVEEQWPVMLNLVNAPSDLKQVEPGQCIRFGVFALGDDRVQLLYSAKFTFEFAVAGTKEAFAPESAQAVKQVKPEGGDFATEALGVAGIKNPLESMASLAASRAKWCAPVDVQDGKATLRGTVTLANGTGVPLDARTIDVKTFESARKQVPFTDMSAFGSWLQGYHAAPDPAQLLPGLRLVAADEKARSILNIMAFFVAALKGSPVAAEELIHKLPGEHPWTRLYAVPILRNAGYPTESLMDGFKDNEKAVLRSVEFPNAFDITPDRALPNKMDMLWATFFATGRLEPVKTIVLLLGWREDYDKFVKMRESRQKPIELTDSIMRGVVYMAAGWSLNALSRSDGLVADYIDVLKSSPDVSAQVKAELANLHTNPAFTKQ
jgi:hypothetical protein